MGFASYRAELYMERKASKDQSLQGILWDIVCAAHWCSIEGFTEVLRKLAYRVYKVSEG